LADVIMSVHSSGPALALRMQLAQRRLTVVGVATFWENGTERSGPVGKCGDRVRTEMSLQVLAYIDPPPPDHCTIDKSLPDYYHKLRWRI
jgi:hypothetical protein